MSITEGFENNHDGNSYNTFAVDQLLAHARALEEMLKEIEFVRWSRSAPRECPCCQRESHSPDCALAKLLG